MYRIIVVDDELIIRKGITNFINNEIDGFEAVQSFRDGDEAVEFLKTNDVDLVISDIKMIHMSGIELAKYIYENKPFIKVVLLSGYKEFEYARSAIQYKVKNYILKPTNFEEFRKTLAEIKLEMDSAPPLERELFLDKVKLVFCDIISNTRDEAKEALLSVFKDCTNHSVNYIRQYIYDLYEIIFDKLKLYFKIQINPDKFGHSRLLEQGSYDEVKNFAFEILENIMNCLSLEVQVPNDYLLRDAKKFIDENFGEDISLQDVADKVFLSSVYFSRFFKKQTGENFSDYLLRIRMEHAAKLLKQNIKIAEVSAACGYNNSGYFSRIFKEYYNCIPKEYTRRFGE